MFAYDITPGKTISMGPQEKAKALDFPGLRDGGAQEGRFREGAEGLHGKEGISSWVKFAKRP